nr:chaplin [Streptomyces boncukensis]
MKRAAAVTIAAGSVVVAGAGVAAASGGHGPQAHGHANESPGIASGNVVQVPVTVPLNVSGNNISAVGILNPVFGNSAVNH